MNCINITKRLGSVLVDALWKFSRRIYALTMIKTSTVRRNVASDDSTVRPVLDIFTRRDSVIFAGNGRTIIVEKVSIHHSEGWVWRKADE